MASRSGVRLAAQCSTLSYFKLGGFAIDRLEEIKWSDEPFEFLVLEKKQKMLIQALVRQHISQTYQFDDFIRGKGKGLVGLLSGRPGCGKTLSAEAIAEKTRCPLYVVSAGELGTTPKDVDERLTLVLQLAHLWKAVLLLDEAEVFLQRRDFSDLTRNALVSIFLRQLEYYQGILILTTNLVSHIDPAFESKFQWCSSMAHLLFVRSNPLFYPLPRPRLQCSQSDLEGFFGQNGKG